MFFPRRMPKLKNLAPSPIASAAVRGLVAVGGIQHAMTRKGIDTKFRVKLGPFYIKGTQSDLLVSRTEKGGGPKDLVNGPWSFDLPSEPINAQQVACHIGKLMLLLDRVETMLAMSIVFDGPSVTLFGVTLLGLSSKGVDGGVFPGLWFAPGGNLFLIGPSGDTIGLAGRVFGGLLDKPVDKPAEWTLLDKVSLALAMSARATEKKPTIEDLVSIWMNIWPNESFRPIPQLVRHSALLQLQVRIGQDDTSLIAIQEMRPPFGLSARVGPKGTLYEIRNQTDMHAVVGRTLALLNKNNVKLYHKLVSDVNLDTDEDLFA